MPCFYIPIGAIYQYAESMVESVNKFSVSLTSSLTSLFRTGGFLLVLIFVGLLTTAMGTFFGGTHSGAIIAVGEFVTMTSVVLVVLELHGSAKAHQQLGKFCELLSGCWWERITPVDSGSLSFVTIEPDLVTGTIRMHGDTFDPDGQCISSWESVAACINLNEKKVFYYWQGTHEKKANRSYQGFGQISFHADDEGIQQGNGFFSDTNLEDWSTTRKLVAFRRCSKKDADIMKKDDGTARRKLISGKVNRTA